MNSILSVKFSDSKSNFSSHYHDCHELFYVTKGKADFIIGSKTYTAQPFQIIIISRYENHSVHILSDDYERYTLRISPNTAADNPEFQSLYSVLENRPESFCHVTDVSVKKDYFDALFAKLKGEFDSASEYRVEMSDMYLRQILIGLFRLEPSLFSSACDETAKIIQNIQSKFQKDCAKKYSLFTLSSQYGISIYHLSHQFKNVTGYSVMNYLLSCRIANAKRLLVKTALDIGDIAGECGFNDSANFSRKFKEETGCSPSEFRKKRGVI